MNNIQIQLLEMFTFMAVSTLENFFMFILLSPDWRVADRRFIR